ncbi:MAG: substrate-binding domain-containing protein, partial [Selenomonadaceae bacterium]|nr:substrate-binding domain-containing protein [Selenomonadaceae bacterium]
NCAYTFLKPYIDKGQLIVPSGQTDFRTVATDGWKPDNAQRRMTEILQKYYADGKSLNVVIAANDDLAEALIKAEESVGYKGTPTILTGQDAGANGVANIKAGKQTMTIYKDPAVLCSKIVRMVKAVVEGSQPAINDVTNIRNDVMTVPSYLCIPMIVDSGNINIVKDFK